MAKILRSKESEITQIVIDENLPTKGSVLYLNSA